MILVQASCASFNPDQAVNIPSPSTEGGTNPIQDTSLPSPIVPDPIKQTAAGETPPADVPTPTRLLTKATPGRFPSCIPPPYNQDPLERTPFPIATLLPVDPYPSPSLRELAEARDFFVGTAATPWLYAEEADARMLSQQFNMIASENAMKWEIIHPEPDRYDFSQGDALVAFAARYNMAFFAHVLVWDLQMPAWVTEAEHTRAEWVQILCTHIKTVVGHYQGQIYAWDVVNEAINNDGSLRNTFWLRKIGPEHVAMAFQWAREADPAALLFYNDNEGEGLNAKSQAIYSLMRSLKESGIPIDGVGLQMHTALYMAPSPSALRANIQRLGDLGLEVHITEMDVKLQMSRDDEQTRLEAQAETYRQVVAACLSETNCKAFITWGMTDQYSWIPWWTGNPDAPLLFDEEGNPKPAFYAVQEQLAGP
jgi:endo-1,4-beta-xylanase